jgi:hypothetical protein
VCPPGEACVPGGLGTCGCVPADSTLCVESDYPSCSGNACPGGQTCVAFPFSAGEIRCVCPAFPCSGGFYPTCGGSCPGGATCTPVTFGEISGCICVP